MTDPMNDADFEAYIERRSLLSRRYRTLTDDQPPKELDEAVMHRARSALVLEKKDAPDREYYIGWMAPVAFAATVVLVVSVVLQIVIRPTASPAVLESASRASTTELAPAAAAPAAGEADFRATNTVRDAERTQAAASAAGNSEPRAPASDSLAKMRVAAPRPTPERKDVGTLAEISSDKAEKPAQATQLETARSKDGDIALTASKQSAGAADRYSTASAPTVDLKKVRNDPEQWLAYIASLRKSGQAQEADQEMKRFLEAFPDYFRTHPLPDDAR